MLETPVVPAGRFRAVLADVATPIAEPDAAATITAGVIARFPALVEIVGFPPFDPVTETNLLADAVCVILN